MATNLSIDSELLERAVKVSGEKTKTAAVTAALREFLVRREQAGILDLFGTLEWDETYDYQQERSRGLRSPGTARYGR
ncbi:MAG: type II toxin-antitoxin system VapB family antitoxin [Holophagales bacterium]|nr:type II toxin-antitoxin system VapB family antitoxin [Holophagales bacterium]MYA09460.1 type II toxin-antitoxin system VapB family antitoxin [Holophagales bacterium]MYC08650.1 type II toxin-antitoxin system VapB family antitoxin [Holophagales bacterium]MYG31015.1 type II toxin-antitoxin system VapB family antitoxin [Holophagales bacterium]MYI80139.1 type II toxin-antitoxin system VapB family antitoxin [Holophagales bacterium]